MSCASTSLLKCSGENPRFHGHLRHDGSFEDKEQYLFAAQRWQEPGRVTSAGLSGGCLVCPAIEGLAWAAEHVIATVAEFATSRVTYRSSNPLNAREVVM